MGKKEIFFDLSTTATGYAVFEDEKYLCSGVLPLSTTKNPDGVKRAYEMLRSINEIVLIYQPRKIFGEQATVVKNKGQDVTNFLHGGFRFLAISNGVDCSCPSTPSHWRKVLEFDQSREVKGEASKKAKRQSLKRASEFTRKEITDDNEADAICLGIAHYIEQAKEGQQYAAPI